MTTATLPLDQVARRIAQQETELTKLYHEYAARKNQLGELTRRQQTLQTQRNQVESQIQAVTLGSAPSAAAPAKPNSEAKPQKAFTYVTLPDLLIPLLREAQGQPLTSRQLTDAALRRGFTTTSRNPSGGGDGVPQWQQGFPSRRLCGAYEDGRSGKRARSRLPLEETVADYAKSSAHTRHNLPTMNGCGLARRVRFLQRKRRFFKRRARLD